MCCWTREEIAPYYPVACYACAVPMLYSLPRLTHAARRPLHRDFLVAADLAQTPERANSEAIVIMTEAGEIAIAHPDAAAVAETESKRPRVGGTMPLELKEKVEKSLLEIGEVEACGPYAFLGPFVRALCMGGSVHRVVSRGIGSRIGRDPDLCRRGACCRRIWSMRRLGRFAKGRRIVSTTSARTPVARTPSGPTRKPFCISLHDSGQGGGYTA